ncbi:MAG: hypothetical protein H0X33_14095 [Taibaiella sp.]|nr:hypothetical protein [Taibaiella sp.]
MALGFCPALLTNIDAVAESDSPTKKLHVAGFLAALFCCQNSAVNPINQGVDGAHLRPLTVKYRQRPTVSQVQTQDDCDINRIPAYAEWTAPSVAHMQSSFFLDDNTIQHYCRDASILRPIGVPPTQVMQEVYGLVLETANVVMKAINQALVTQMATAFGANTTTGSTFGKVLNISSAANQYNLSNGIIDMMRDFQENELCGDPCIIGGGLFAAYNMAQAATCCNQAGMDISKIGVPRFFFDKDTQSIWGQNSIGVLAPGSVKFIGRNKYQGAFAGQRGNSFFTTFALPVNEFGCNLDDCLGQLVFDLQLRYIDCPGTYTVNDVNTPLQRGWEVIISKEFALWVQPTNAYAYGDPLYNTNGTLKYFVSNTGYTGGSYTSPYS